MAALVRSMRPSPHDAQAIMMAAIYNGLALAAALRGHVRTSSIQDRDA